MSWRRGELWLDTDILWLGERAGSPALAGERSMPLPSHAPPPGLAASRRRRDEWARHRHARRARASAVALSPAVVFALAGLRSDSARTTSFLAEDPPSLTFRIGPALDVLADGAVPAVSVSAPKRHSRRTTARAGAMPTIGWHHARSLGLPYGGSLVNGTQLPVKGPDWVTWNPITDSRPNLPHRLYANEHTIRAIVSVTRAYRAAHPHAPLVVVGDISREGGGRMDDHVSHQNGLDVDVYFPRRDRRLQAPIETAQIDHRLAQDLLDGFVAAGAQKIFVSSSSGFEGPADVVMPWPGHDYHMHVRFPAR
jgi:murein endopeptidase